MTISRDHAQPEWADADARQDAPGAEIVPGAALVLTALAAARRRIRLTLLARAASVAGPAGVTLGAAGVLLPLGSPPWLPVLLGSAGLAGATVWALLRTPSLASTASALDARLDLRDRTAAAYQLHGSSSPVAGLVVHDAATHLAALSVAAVFPFAVPRAALVLAPLAVLLGTAVAWPVSPRDRAERETAAQSGAGMQQPAAARSSATTPAPETAARNSAGPEAEASRGTRGTAASATPSEPRPPRERSEETAGRRGARPEDTVPRPGQSPARGKDANPATPADARIAEQQPRGGAPATPPDAAIAAADTAAAQGGRGLANPARPSQAGTVARGSGGRGASDTDATPLASAGRGAGGVSQGPLAALPRLASTGFDRSQAPAGLAARYPTARAGAEAALTRDTVPPDLRDYVREYFRAIAPAGQR